MSHIATTDSFFVYPEMDIISICFLCGKDCIQEHSYIGIRCTHCKITLSLEESLGELCQIMRAKIGLNRRKFGVIVGYSKHTIKSYEFNQPTEKYYKKVIKVFRNWINTKEQNENAD